MTRTTGNGAGRGGSPAGPHPGLSYPGLSHDSPAAAGEVSVALAALQGLRADLQQALARAEAAIALIEGPPAAASRNGLPEGPPGTTARPKRPAPLREKGKRGRRAPVLPGRRTPPTTRGSREPAETSDDT